MSTKCNFALSIITKYIIISNCLSLFLGDFKYSSAAHKLRTNSKFSAQTPCDSDDIKYCNFKLNLAV